MIASYVGENANLKDRCWAENWKLSWYHKGLWQRWSAQSGFSCIFTPAGYGTGLAEVKKSENSMGKMYVMEMALKCDFAIVKAWNPAIRSRKFNFQRNSTCNFNPLYVCGAAKITIAEVEELVPRHIRPQPNSYSVFSFSAYSKGKHYEKRIEQRNCKVSSIVI